MKKKKVARQILSTALCVMMLSAYVPQTAFAEDGASTGGTSYIASTETDTSVGAGSVTRTATGSAVSVGVASVTTTDNGTTSYTDFDEALTAAQAAEGSTLKLLADHNGAVIVTSGNFTLDLNGHTITNESGTAIIGTVEAIILTITDTAGGGCIIGSDKGVHSYSGRMAINGGTITGGDTGVKNDNNGTMTISGGTITGGDTGVSNVSGTLEISGGSITGSNYGVANNGKVFVSGTATVKSDQWGISNNGEVAISGGSITGGDTGVDNDNNGTMTINGGTINGGVTSVSNVSGTLTISGGTITGVTYGVKNSYGEVTISGGTITSEYGVTNSSGTLTITDAPVIEGTVVDFLYWGGTIDLSRVTEGKADGWTMHNWSGTAMTIGTAGTNLITPEGYEVQVFCQAVESMGMEGTGIVAKTGTHSGEPVYSAEENKITESCSFCQAEIGSAVITAEGGTYNGSAYEAVVNNEGTFADKTWNITYKKDSEALTGAPVNAGTYTASISMGEGVTASVNFTIEKKKLTVTEATAVTKTYDGSAAVTVTGVTLGGIISNDDVSVVLTSLTGTVDSANAGTYTEVTLPALSLTGEQAENYILPEGVVAANVIINKAAAAPNLPESTMSVSYQMKTVGAVTLPADWAWVEADAAKALVVDTAVTVTAVYAGTDKGNYETETVSVAITRSACSHTGGTATCTEKAVCTVCGEAYGAVDNSNHEETVTRNAVSATCTTAGYTGDTYCKDCGAGLGSGTSIAKTSHWDGNNDGACDTCGYVMAAPTPVVTPEVTPAVTPSPTAAPEVTPAPTYHPEKSWVTEAISKAYEEAAKQYDVLLGTSAKEASMVKTMQVGGTIDLNFYGVKNWKKDGYTYQWTSSDESIATVNNVGVVTMLDEGIVIVKLELVEMATGKKLSVAPMLIGVPEADYDIFLGTSAKDVPLKRELPLGEKVDLNFYGVKGWKKDDYEYEWTTTDEEIATVGEDGMVTAKAPGQAIIRLKLKRKATGEYLVVAPVVLTVPEKTEE